MTTSSTTAPGDPRAWGGPAATASFLTGVAAAMALADAPYPRPGVAAADVQRYFRGSARAAQLSVAGQLVSAASLAAFGSSVASLAARSGGPRVLTAAAAAGSGAAAASLAVSALSAAALTGRPGARESTAAALHRLAFLAGGPVHTSALGVLVGAAALAGRRTGELPRSLTTAGLASATAALLSPLSLIAAPAVWLIPAGRFSGLIVCTIAGVLLATRGGGGTV